MRLIIQEAKGRKPAREYLAPKEFDFHVEGGTIPQELMLSGGSVVVAGRKYTVLPASFPDRYSRLERGVQIITPKDLGLIIVETGLNRDSVVLDIGFGSGAVTAYLCRIAKEVHAYDVVDENIAIGLKNLKSLETPENYSVEKGDAYNSASIKEEDVVDLFVLDVPEPWRALSTAKKALKIGGWLVSYSPCITQTNEFVDSLDESWHHVKTCEMIEREWKAKGKAVRPVTKDFGHSAFLTFVRKVS